MANPEHLELLKQGIASWNEWRKGNPRTVPDLIGANLSKADLSSAHLIGANLSGAFLSEAYLSEAKLGSADLSKADLREAYLTDAKLSRADLSGADLSGANLSKADLALANLAEADLSLANLYGANLFGADLSSAHLYGANLSSANLWSANLSKADLSSAHLYEANLSFANLSGADLSGADLAEANLVHADLRGAKLSQAKLDQAQLIRTDIRCAELTGSSIYGISAWDVKVDSGTQQQNLIITPPDEPVIVVDNIKVAQFIYLLLANEEIRDVIDTITSKAVLILGRFSPERKIILDRLREELRARHYVPILFDFEQAKSRDTVETIRILAGMAKFVIADLTDAKSVLQELQAIVPNLPSVVVRFIIKKSEQEPGMLDHIRRFPWVIDGAFEYETPEEVIESINENVLKPVEAKLKELSL
jgi:uncharacterized protein YjbI with pentapeptide repeats